MKTTNPVPLRQSTAHHQQRLHRLLSSQPSGHLAEEEGRPHPERNPESRGRHQEVDERGHRVAVRLKVKK